MLTTARVCKTMSPFLHIIGRDNMKQSTFEVSISILLSWLLSHGGGCHYSANANILARFSLL